MMIAGFDGQCLVPFGALRCDRPRTSPAGTEANETSLPWLSPLTPVTWMDDVAQKRISVLRTKLQRAQQKKSGARLQKHLPRPRRCAVEPVPRFSGQALARPSGRRCLRLSSLRPPVFAPSSVLPRFRGRLKERPEGAAREARKRKA